MYSKWQKKAYFRFGHSRHLLIHQRQGFCWSSSRYDDANDRVNNEFYTCPVYNYMIKNGARIGVNEVAMSAMDGLGTPDDLSQFLQERGAEPSLDSPG